MRTTEGRLLAFARHNPEGAPEAKFKTPQGSPALEMCDGHISQQFHPTPARMYEIEIREPKGGPIVVGKAGSRRSCPDGP